MSVNAVEFIGSFTEPLEVRRDRLPEIVFVGRSNVGKSSLINALVQRKRLAKISRTPGKTRTVNFYRIGTTDAEIKSFYAVDLPGYGYAKVAKTVREQWGPMIERYLGTDPTRRAVILLVDVRGSTEHDALTHEWLHALGYHPIVVATKVDKIPYGRRSQCLLAVRDALKLPHGTPVHPFSSRTGEGRPELWQAIRTQIRPR